MADTIAKVETFMIRIPFKGETRFRSVQDTKGPYAFLRLTTKDGAVGIAETNVRPQQKEGHDLAIVVHQIHDFFEPMLKGADPLSHNEILQKMNRYKGCRFSKAMVDMALWDLKGKLMGQPVWRLLGGSPDVKKVPVSAIVLGDTAKGMVKYADDACNKRGITGLKVKIWRRSNEDVEMMRDIRKAVGDDVFIYGDSNGAYTEQEAVAHLSKMIDYNVAMLEDPCKLTTIDRMAQLARQLPIAILGDGISSSLGDAHAAVKANAVGAVNVKLARCGITEALKIIALCEAAGLPNVIGTDTETRIGALARVHVRAAITSLHPYPCETQFFERLTGDCFKGDFEFKNGHITVPNVPGFGAEIDEKAMKKYLV
jgi:L-alanine-DL-glutamate epimerase-like enolase superfamily enzyme